MEPHQRCAGIGPAARRRDHRGSPQDPARETGLPVQPGKHDPPARGPHTAGAARVPAWSIPLADGGGDPPHGAAQARLGTGLRARGRQCRPGPLPVRERPLHERVPERPLRGARGHRPPVRGGRHHPRVPDGPRRARGGRRAAGIARHAVRRGCLLPPAGFRRGRHPGRAPGGGQDRAVEHRRDQLHGAAPPRLSPGRRRLRFAGRGPGVRRERPSGRGNGRALGTRRSGGGRRPSTPESDPAPGRPSGPRRGGRFRRRRRAGVRGRLRGSAGRRRHPPSGNRHPAGHHPRIPGHGGRRGADGHRSARVRRRRLGPAGGAGVRCALRDRLPRVRPPAHRSARRRLRSSSAAGDRAVAAGELPRVCDRSAAAADARACGRLRVPGPSAAGRTATRAMPATWRRSPWRRMPKCGRWGWTSGIPAFWEVASRSWPASAGKPRAAAPEAVRPEREECASGRVFSGGCGAEVS